MGGSFAAWLFIASLAAGCGKTEFAISPAAPLQEPGRAQSERPLASLLLVRVPTAHLADDAPWRPQKIDYKKPYRFTEDWFSHNLFVWQKAMEPLKGKPNLRYLEVGVFEGRALLWMLENVFTHPSCRVTTIDPFLDEYKDRYRENLRESGQESRVTTVVGYSQIELRKLPLDSFDAIYIDGSHNADDVLEDVVLSWRLLKVGGLFIFDDYQWTGWKQVEPPENTPKPAINVFYLFYGKYFDVVHNGYQIILRKRPGA